MTWRQKHTVPSARAEVQVANDDANRCRRLRATGEYKGKLAAMAGTDAMC